MFELFWCFKRNIDTIAEAATAQIWLISTAPHIPFSPNPKNERR